LTHKPTERVLNILELLAAHPKGMTLTQLSADLQIPKSTISPILQELTDRNFLYLQPHSSLYSIGISTYCVGSTYEQERALLPFIKTCMKKISTEIHEICQVGVLDGPDVLYILKQDPEIPLTIKIISYVGKRIPAYCTALGKALLCDSSLEELQALYPEPLIPQTPNTITDLNLLYEQLQEIRKSSIATEYEEVTPQLCCFAVPIRLNSNRRYAMSVSMPLFRTSKEKIQRTKELLLVAKGTIEKFDTTPHN